MKGMAYDRFLGKAVPKLKCANVVENIPAFVKEELEEDHMAWMEAHVQTCVGCTEAYAAQKEADNAKRHNVSKA